MWTAAVCCPVPSAIRSCADLATVAGRPDISMAMAADLLALCDPYQFRIFSLDIFYGLRAAEGNERAPLLGSPLAALIAEFQTRLARESLTAGQRQCLRDRIVREAGGLSYDRVEDEFRGLAVEREWGPVRNGVQDRVDRLSPQVSIAI